jgi:D-alanyl-D-alanine carboxypeptidase/D-alanyl-D-alanine-endopeptidase (penicillin-binding protein 4)
VRRRVEHPGPYFGATFRRLLASGGIKVAGKTTRFGVVPKTAKALASRRSQPVGVLVHEMSKTSNNFMAEMLLKTISLEVGGPPASWARGIAAVKDASPTSASPSRATNTRTVPASTAAPSPAPRP